MENGHLKKWASIVSVLLLVSLHPPARAEEGDEQKLLLKKYRCLVCHGLNNKVVGPSFTAIAQRRTPNDIEKLTTIILKGSVNVWGNIPMPASKKMPEDEARNVATWIASLNPANVSQATILGTQTTLDKFIPTSSEISVMELSQFERYSGPDVSKIGVPVRGLDIANFDRHRLGSVQLASNLRVFVDKLTLPGHVEYEFIDTVSGDAIRGVSAIGGRYGASDLRFTGGGIVYVTQKFACRQGGTFKFVLRDRELVMTPQPLVSVDMKTAVEGDVKLFQKPDGGEVIATLQNGTDVNVIGRDPDNTLALLVKTPIGLTGWIVEGDKSGGKLLMDACD